MSNVHTALNKILGKENLIDTTKRDNIRLEKTYFPGKTVWGERLYKLQPTLIVQLNEYWMFPFKRISNHTISIPWPSLVVGSLCSWAAGQFTPHICVKRRKGIHSCATCLGHEDLVEPIPSQVKRQPMSSNLKDCSGHWHMTGDSIGEPSAGAIEFNLRRSPPRDVLSSPYWLHIWLNTGCMHVEPSLSLSVRWPFTLED